MASGQWEEVVDFSAETEYEVCGEMPENNEDFIVCNFTQEEWQKFEPIGDEDFRTCGEKPADIPLGKCNTVTNHWE